MFRNERTKLITLSKIIHYYNGILKINTKDHQAYYQIGLAHKLLGQKQLAIKHLKQALKYNKNNPEYLEELGITHYWEKEYYEAIKQFTALLKQKQKNRLIIYYLALSYKALGDGEKAKALFDRLFESDTTDFQVIKELANYYIEKKEYRKSLFYYELLDKQNPDLNINKFLGFLYEKAGLIEKAVEAYTHVIKNNSEDWKVWFTLGLLHKQKEEYSSARTCFMQLVRNQVANADIYYYLAYVCVKLKDPRALEFIQEAIALNKDYIQKIKEENTFSNIKKTKEYLELLQLTDKRIELLEKIVFIDGSNVAHYANGRSPSLENILMMINKLDDIGFEKIFVITGSGLWHYIDDKEQYEQLKDQGLIIQSPAKTDDDLLILKTAIEKQGLIVSNDSFNEYQTDSSTSKYLKINQIRYTIIDGMIQLVMAKNHYLN